MVWTSTKNQTVPFYAMWLFFNISLSTPCFTVFPEHITKICYICLKYAYCTWKSLVWPAEISIYLQKIQPTLCRFLLLYSPFYKWSRLDHYCFNIYQQHHRSGPGVGGGGTPIWNRRACSSEILNLTPKGDHLGVAQAYPEGDQSGRGLSKFWPLKTS